MWLPPEHQSGIGHFIHISHTLHDPFVQWASVLGHSAVWCCTSSSVGTRDIVQGEEGEEKGRKKEEREKKRGEGGGKKGREGGKEEEYSISFMRGYVLVM